MKLQMLIFPFLIVCNFIKDLPVVSQNRKVLEICDISNFENKIKQKPEISLLFDNHRITKNDTNFINIKDFVSLDFKVDYFTIDVPRKCYYFEKVEFVLWRKSERRQILIENYRDLDKPVDLSEVKSKYLPGDILSICPFPKLKNGYEINYCPPVFNVKLR